ncbi:hypothetical protein M8C21_025973 [Ambrosia artemisiifolia]|uniref:F-box domain-containing protein n=1 Tax=Ambrosia artemisiifolia TaxID=4212 RepID=A0AAD5D739_AMBAR|nr:hypothetical protein M8C21_025973 [Ambrosia artemisiifolia]
MDSHLSTEMIMEIVSRTSLKTLGVMRCTSKEFNTLAYESYLLDLCKKRKKIVSGFIIQNMKRGCMYIKDFAPSPKSDTLDLRFLPYNTQILATSEQGMVVFKNQSDHGEEFVSRRWRKLYTTYRCDIFDSMTWEWRSLKHVMLAYCVSLTNPQPITKGGSIYMLLTNNHILKFNAHSETWKVFSSPIPYDESRTSTELVKYGGRLGLASKPPNANGCWDIWVLTKDGLWEKEGGGVVESESERESLKALYDSDTSVMVDRERFLYYRFKQGNNMIKKVVLNDTPYQIFSFRSDFEPVDLI